MPLACIYYYNNTAVNKLLIIDDLYFCSLFICIPFVLPQAGVLSAKFSPTGGTLASAANDRLICAF